MAIFTIVCLTRSCASIVLNYTVHHRRDNLLRALADRVLERCPTLPTSPTLFPGFDRRSRPALV
jgi:hypothetical protein